MSYIETLIDNCQKAKMANPLRELVMQNLSDLDGIGKAIYIIEQLEGDHEKTFLEFSRFKQLKTRACAKLNSPSKVLYVGSSTTNLVKRISEHLGNGNKGTYALHLKHWFKDKYQITIKVYDVPLDVLQIIEDALSHALRPAFGKRGGNGQ